MKKLKNKVFFTVFLIFTISIFSFIILFNVQNYMKQKQSIINALNITTNNDKKDFRPEPNNQMMN